MTQFGVVEETKVCARRAKQRQLEAAAAGGVREELSLICMADEFRNGMRRTATYVTGQNRIRGGR